MFSFKLSDSFIGYQNDTPAAVVFQASHMIQQDDCIDRWNEEVPSLIILYICCPNSHAGFK